MMYYFKTKYEDIIESMSTINRNLQSDKEYKGKFALQQRNSTKSAINCCITEYARIPLN